jgi:hypothetical protein
MSRATDIEIVVPYGNSNAATHIRFAKDYVTFCGRQCEGWSVVDGATLTKVIDSAFACKRCVKGALK